MSRIVSIGTAVPSHRHNQGRILDFMQQVYALDEREARKLRFLYNHSGIDTRYSVIRDYSRPISEWKFYPQSENLEPFPSLEQRMSWFNRFAAPLSIDAIRNCLDGKLHDHEITHLITVSCTGMSAPGLDLQVMELMDLPKNIYRTSVNFMGCYAAIHALKMADAICRHDDHARVMIVCTELCTLHFQREATQDNIASSLLFGDGSAAMLVMPDRATTRGLRIDSFYSEVVAKGKKDMAWELSSSGFLMTLSGYIPELLQEDFEPLVERALQFAGTDKKAVSQWCIHPGGKRILESIHKSLELHNGELDASYDVLRRYGNMSSPTILFVLKEMMHNAHQTAGIDGQKIFAAAFGPGLTMETFLASY
ncbi:MAG TPA: type III polyketide synthase [Chitinophagaceae bacterium]